MKKQTGIWIDSSKAIVVTLQDSAINVKTLKSNIENRIYHNKEGDNGSFSGSQHINNEKKFDERKKHQTKEFLQQVCTQMKGTNSVYIFGPAEMKKHLKKVLLGDKSLSKAALEVESAEEMTQKPIDC